MNFNKVYLRIFVIVNIFLVNRAFSFSKEMNNRIWFPNMSIERNYIPFRLQFVNVNNSIYYSCEGGLAKYNIKDQVFDVFYLGDDTKDFIIISMASDGKFLYAANRKGIFIYNPETDSIIKKFTPNNSGLKSTNNYKLLYDQYENCLWIAGSGSLDRWFIESDKWENFNDIFIREFNASKPIIKYMGCSLNCFFCPFSANVHSPGGVLIYYRNSKTWEGYRNEINNRISAKRIDIIDFAKAEDEFYVSTSNNVITLYNSSENTFTYLGNSPENLPSIEHNIPKIEGILTKRCKYDILQDIFKIEKFHSNFSDFDSIQIHTDTPRYIFNNDIYAKIGKNSVSFFNSDHQQIISFNNLRSVYKILDFNNGNLLLHTNMGLELFSLTDQNFFTIKLQSNIYRSDHFNAININSIFYCIKYNYGESEDFHELYIIDNKMKTAKSIKLPFYPKMIGKYGNSFAFKNNKNNVFVLEKDNWKQMNNIGRFKEVNAVTNFPNVILKDNGLWINKE